MKKIILSVFIVAAFGFYMPENSRVEEPEKALKKVEWLSFEEALERSKTEKRKIFIDVYTDWCGWCTKMDKNTFSHEVVSELLSDHYYAVKFDAEQKEPIEFDGKTFKFIESGRRGYHELAVALLNGKLSYPTVVFLDEDFNMIQPIPGYQPPQGLAPILEFIGEEHYTNTDWKEFSKNYKFPSGK